MFYAATITITSHHTGLGNYLVPLTSSKDRSRIAIDEDPDGVRIRVEAADCPAFRAAVNNVTHALSVFDTVNSHG